MDTSRRTFLWLVLRAVRHRRCDDKQPCSRCIKFNSECVYIKTKPRGGRIILTDSKTNPSDTEKTIETLNEGKNSSFYRRLFT